MTGAGAAQKGSEDGGAARADLLEMRPWATVAAKPREGALVHFGGWTCYLSGSGSPPRNPSCCLSLCLLFYLYCAFLAQDVMRWNASGLFMALRFFFIDSLTMLYPPTRLRYVSLSPKITPATPRAAARSGWQVPRARHLEPPRKRRGVTWCPPPRRRRWSDRPPYDEHTSFRMLIAG